MRRVQPVTIAYSKIYNVPMSMIDRPLFAWYGDMDLAPHLWQFLHIGSATIEITLHDPVEIEPGMVYFCHMIIFDSDAQLAMCLGETVLTTDGAAERLSRSPLDLIHKA